MSFNNKNMYEKETSMNSIVHLLNLNKAQPFMILIYLKLPKPTEYSLKSYCISDADIGHFNDYWNIKSN